MTLHVPLWLQVLTVALAPMAGFLGVAVGAFMTIRAGHSRWLREERVRVYSGFIGAVTDYSSYHGGELRRSIIEGQATMGAEVLQRMPELLAGVNKGYFQTELIASESVAHTARRTTVAVAQLVVFAYNTIEGMSIGDPFDRDAYDNKLIGLHELMAEFRNHALLDLALPHKDRYRQEWVLAGVEDVKAASIVSDLLATAPPLPADEEATAPPLPADEDRQQAD